MMKKLTDGILLLILGWGIGWVSHLHWGSETPSSHTENSIIQHRPIKLYPPVNDNIAPQTIPKSVTVDEVAQLLKKNAFHLAVERFETLQQIRDEVVIQTARRHILSYGRELIEAKHNQLAIQLLNLYIETEFRDVDARLLLIEAYIDANNYRTAIDNLYEAKGYAYQPVILDRISQRIRTVVSRYAKLLEGNYTERLALIQHLTQLEPSYAPYFIELALAQLAVNDSSGAMSSLQLVVDDHQVGPQAQDILSNIRLAESQAQDAVASVQASDIPLVRDGNQYFVEASVSNSQRVRLLIDTGASMTIMTPDVFKRNDIKYTDTGKSHVFATANGQVTAPVYVIETLAVGEWQVNHLKIGVLQLSSSNTIDGLLGMNFLRHFQFFIDQNEATLRLIR